MGNGAEKLFNVMRKSNDINNNQPSLVTLTVKSLNPLIFKLDDKLTITEEFYVLDSNNTFFALNEQYKAIPLNNGQLYYIYNTKSVNWGNITGTLTNQTDLKTELDKKLNYTDIIDNLTDDSTNKPLSAKQGKKLNIDKVNYTDIIDNLTSTDADKPLSAKQGKKLKDLIDNFNYSLSEKQVGTWIDGKPLYKRTIELNNVTISNGVNTFQHNISNLKKCIDSKIITQQNIYIFPYLWANGTSLTVLDRVDSTSITIISNDDWGTESFYVTLIYTKTTD